MSLIRDSELNKVGINLSPSILGFMLLKHAGISVEDTKLALTGTDYD